MASIIIDYLSADREEHVSIAQANTPLDEHDRIIPDGVTVRVGGGHRFPVDSGRRRPVHGRLAEAGCFGGDGVDPVPRARRRKPRPDGREHAAAGSSAGAAAGAGYRHGRRAPSRERLRSGAGLPSQRHRQPVSTPGRSRSVTMTAPSSLLPAEVRPLEPGHLHQPAAERQEGRSDSGWSDRGRFQFDRKR